MSNSADNSKYVILNPRPEHFQEIQELCRRVYPFTKPWSIAQLESHRSYFPDGQLIALDPSSGKVVGLAFSLIIPWTDYSPQDNWSDFTSGGFFHNHNPKEGSTLYGAEVMVDPEMQGRGIGKLLYQGRREIVNKYNLKRIRAGARLRGYSKFKDKMSPQEYVRAVIKKELYDPTLSFQLHREFVVIDVAKNYLSVDPESLGYAAVIEWLNPKTTTESDYRRQNESINVFMNEEKFIPEHLPRELRKLVRRSTLVLGQIIREQEGEPFYRKIESLRKRLKKSRMGGGKSILSRMLKDLSKESQADQIKIAHAFALQLEIVNSCESAYRTWRQRQKPIPQGLKSKINLNFVLTAHPTEARSKDIVETLNRLGQLLLGGIHNNFVFNDNEIASQVRLLWLHPLAKTKSPSVKDEAEYLFSLIFDEDTFDFILDEKPSFDLRLRTWVGGDKDGHPMVNKEVMRECLELSREYIVDIIDLKIDYLQYDLEKLQKIGTIKKNKFEQLSRLSDELDHLVKIKSGDGNRVRKWYMLYQSFLKSAHPFIQKHHEVLLINRIFTAFPGLVFPIELREDAGQIAKALADKNSPIRQMLTELQSIAGPADITKYARGLVISHCEHSDDIENAYKLTLNVCKNKRLPIIPLFESKESLINSSKILKGWLGNRQNLETVNRYWENLFEIMLGYSDSAKQIGVLPSRNLIHKSMFDIEKTIKSYGLTPVFFHGSGGSIARGGGSFKDQISWWPNSAVQRPKLTIQGEMVQRLFATPEVLNSQCIHLSNESTRRRVRNSKVEKSKDLDKFVSIVEKKYQDLVGNLELLNKLLDATPYKYLEILKIGSRPSSRASQEATINSLRAIPWVLCWTQSRVLLPSWWGVGSAWEQMTEQEKLNLAKHYQSSAFLTSFVKILGFTLAKVELDVWRLYFQDKNRSAIIKDFNDEYERAVKFVKEISNQRSLVWYRPWLEESIRLRSPHIHILNLLQILAMNNRDEKLLRETLVGIACGMLTTG